MRGRGLDGQWRRNFPAWLNLAKNFHALYTRTIATHVCVNIQVAMYNEQSQAYRCTLILFYYSIIIFMPQCCKNLISADPSLSTITSTLLSL